MKKREFSEQLKRASDVIKSDRLGMSSDIEGIINNEVSKVLSDYFVISEKCRTSIEVSDKDFVIKIVAKARGAKQIKII